MYLFKSGRERVDEDEVPWFRAVSTSGRCPIYRQREGPGMLGAWARQDMGRRTILLERKDVDLPLKARRRVTTLLERIRGLHGPVDPVSLHWEEPAKSDGCTK